MRRKVTTGVWSGSPFEPQIGFARATRIGDHTGAIVAQLFDPRWKVEIEADAIATA